jgi:hypothetical protein
MKGAADEAEHDFWQAAWHAAMRMTGME